MVFQLPFFYGILALTHLFNQINLGHIEYLRTRKEGIDVKFTPSVAIIIPSYNEENPGLELGVLSALNQKYRGKYKVIVVDDGSKRKDAFNSLRLKHGKNPKLILHEFKENKGKRHAQKHAFDTLVDHYDVLVTIDSDTILRKDAIQNLVQKFRDPRVGAITGDVRAQKTKKILSWLIDARYWTAFHQERAAQSLFGTVLCCSGPLAAYRSSIVKRIKDKYVAQKFLGQNCTYGDDRHLTNLVLDEGHLVKFDYRAKAKTAVPTNFKSWIKQQVRWNRSFYREILWTLKIILQNPKKLHPYVMYDLTIQTLLPFLLFFSIGYMVFLSLTDSFYHIAGYLSMLVGVALIRGAYAIFRTGDKNFLLFPIYAFLHIFLLVPVRMYALMTLKTTRWGTR